MSEAKFQEEVLRSFRALGWCATHLSPPSCPGWDDVIALQYPYGLVLELKVFSDEDWGKKVSSLFTKAQRPRYLEQLGFNIGVVWVGFMSEEGFCYLVSLQDQSDVSSLSNMTIRQMSEAGSTLGEFYDVDGMVDCLCLKTQTAMSGKIRL